jgi:hypothetical protein
VLDAFTEYQDVLCITNTIGAITYNISYVCNVAPRPTRPRGHVARRSAEEPEAPSEAPMHIRAVMRSCVLFYASISSISRVPTSIAMNLRPLG